MGQGYIKKKSRLDKVKERISSKYFDTKTICRPINKNVYK